MKSNRFSITLFTLVIVAAHAGRLLPLPLQAPARLIIQERSKSVCPSPTLRLNAGPSKLPR